MHGGGLEGERGVNGLEMARRVLDRELQRLKRESLREFVREFGEVDTMDFR